MIIPKLDRENRSREYNRYNDEQRYKVVYALLFEGKTHREIDKDVLHLNSDYTHGWQAMGILHYLGLKKNFRGIFSGMTVEQAISALKDTKDPEYNILIEILSGSEEIIEKRIENDIQIESEDAQAVRSEGKPTKYYTTRYERNPANRREAIRIHGTRCMACGFDFEKAYGELGKDYIEVHHVVPLASQNEEIKVNPATDLIVVCANCHRMIHRKRDHVLSLEELKEIIRRNRH